MVIVMKGVYLNKELTIFLNFKNQLEAEGTAHMESLNTNVNYISTNSERLKVEQLNSIKCVIFRRKTEIYCSLERFFMYQLTICMHDKHCAELCERCQKMKLVNSFSRQF